MADVWGQLLLGIEFELQGRYDVVGPQVSKFTSKPAPPTFEWARFDPDERQSWKRKAPDVAAWLAAARWARQFRRVRTALASFITKLSDPPALLLPGLNCSGTEAPSPSTSSAT
eukprot:9498281-Pyramimonas_sp.AAC.1